MFHGFCTYRGVLGLCSVGLLALQGCGRLGFDLTPSGSENGITLDAATESPELDASGSGSGAGGASILDPGDATAGLASGEVSSSLNLDSGTPGSGGTLDPGEVDAGASGMPAAAGASPLPPSQADAGPSYPDTGAEPGLPDGGSAESADGRSPAPPSDSAPPEPVSVVYCEELPALLNAPVFDGVLESGMTLEDVVPLAWTGAGAMPPVSMRYAAGWRQDGIYFFIEVTDSELNPAESGDFVWMGDAVEIYLDHDAVYPAPPGWDDPGARQFIVGPPDGVDPPRGDVYLPLQPPLSAWSTSQWTSVLFAGGYRIEGLIIAGDLGLGSWTLAAGMRVGFDLSHDVAYPIGTTGPEGNREGQYFLKVREPLQGNNQDYPYQNETIFCSPSLLPP